MWDNSSSPHKKKMLKVKSWRTNFLGDIQCKFLILEFNYGAALVIFNWNLKKCICVYCLYLLFFVCLYLRLLHCRGCRWLQQSHSRWEAMVVCQLHHHHHHHHHHYHHHRDHHHHQDHRHRDGASPPSWPPGQDEREWVGRRLLQASLSPPMHLMHCNNKLLLTPLHRHTNYLALSTVSSHSYLQMFSRDSFEKEFWYIWLSPRTLSST